MTKLQLNILKRYKEAFPKDRLKDYSFKTKIQITRVHRILNGSAMKLCEYEAFENAINQNQSTTNELISTSIQCIQNLKDSKIKSFILQMNYALKIESLKLQESFNPYTNFNLG